jgi:hypothetical protein
MGVGAGERVDQLGLTHQGACRVISCCHLRPGRSLVRRIRSRQTCCRLARWRDVWKSVSAGTDTREPDTVEDEREGSWG